MDISLDFFGVQAVVSCNSEEVLSWLSFDFSYFRRSEVSSPGLRVKVVFGESPEGLIPELEESEHSPWYVSFDSGLTRYVDYYGKAVVVMDYLREEATLYSEDPAFAYEKLYLLILSRVGELLDRQGLHRVHALGFAFRDEVALFLMPMRGGKSTLALSMLSIPEFRLFSEDTPLISRQGLVYPFPLRLAMREGENLPEIPSEYLRHFERSQYGPKLLISSEYFADKIQASPLPVTLLLSGRWTRAENPSLRPMSGLKAFRKLFRDCVAGLGLPQVVEFFLTTPLRDLASKTPLVISRILSSLRVAMRADCYEFLMTRDRRLNAEFLENFIRERQEIHPSAGGVSSKLSLSLKNL